MNKEKIIIIGSGLSALTVADRLCEHKHVIILTKGKIDQSNSSRAQGGVAASVAKDDHWKSHYTDTLEAGCNFNNKKVVTTLVKEGPNYIKQLIERGLVFDRDKEGELLLGKEGAHMRHRILHAGGDATGRILMDFMKKRIKNKVTIVEDESVIDLIIEDNACVGVVTKNEDDHLSCYVSNHVVLATGGCGAVYQVTSNAPTVTGDGLGIAYRAGAQLMDLEFIQFHPTMLYVDNKCYGLVSEAVRGEGAKLITESGKRLMDNVHPMKDLAPRDIVARSIHREMKKGKTVFLDIHMVDDFRLKFPTITSLCEQANISIEDGLIPVAPGAHFLMGGVKTNEFGSTSVPGLYAVGEVACTGVHGANRLASNSLLEGIVFSNFLADHLLTQTDKLQLIPKCGFNNTTKNNIEKLNLPSPKDLRTVMTYYVGIERNLEDLRYAQQWIEQFDFQNLDAKQIRSLPREQIDCINQLTTCWLIITSAIQRTESRGGHFRVDYPEENSAWQNRHIVRHILEQEREKQMTGVGK